MALRRRNCMVVPLILASFFLVAGLWLRMIPAPAPAPPVVRPLPHAETRHGSDALRARIAIRQCRPEDLQVWFSVTRQQWMFVCPDDTHTLCAGMIVRVANTGTGYVEVTAFVASCQYWQGVVARDRYTTAATAMTGGLRVLQEVIDCE